MNGLLSCLQDGVWLAVPDLVGPCRDLDAADLSGSVGEEEEDDEEEEEEQEQDMGQRSSSLLASRTRPKISLTWVLRGDRQNSSTITTNTTTTTTTSTTAAVATSHPTPTYESPPTSATVNTVEKTTNKYNAKINNNIGVKVNRESNNSSSSSNNNNKYVSATTKRTLSEPSLLIATSDSGRSGRSSREKHRHRRTRTPRHKTEKQRRHSRFGYEIQDVDAFLTKVGILIKNLE